jgi:hypothetical protein
LQGEQAGGVAECPGCANVFPLLGKGDDELKLQLSQVRELCRVNPELPGLLPAPQRPGSDLGWKTGIYVAASFLFCFGVGLVTFSTQLLQDQHEQESQRLRSALLEHERKEIRASNAAASGILPASFSRRGDNNQSRILEAALKDSGGDHPIVTAAADDGAYNVVISAKQVEFLTENAPGDDGQRFLSIIKLAGDNANDKNTIAARIVEIK